MSVGRNVAFDPMLEAPVIIKPPKAVMFTPDEPALDPDVRPPKPERSERKAPKVAFAAVEDEEQASNRPPPGSEAARAAELHKAMSTECEYIITVVTSDLRGAGTDANVFLALYGKDTEGNILATAEFRLDNDRNNFERVRTPQDPHAISVRAVWVFRNALVHFLQLELKSRSPLSCRYSLPFLIICLQYGVPEHHVLGSMSLLLQGRTDEFVHRTNSVGTFSHARIRHDNSGLAAGWHLHKVW
jgi:hypothetical protein